MREKLKDLNIRITELSEYMGLSRPTLYKFLGFYEKGRYKNINDNVLRLFKYIDGTPNIGKANVIAYIVNNPDVLFENVEGIQMSTDSIPTDATTNYVSPDKQIFINNILENDSLDEIIPYLNRCFTVLQKEVYSDEDYGVLSRLILFKDDVSKDRKATSFKIERTKEMMRSDE